MNLKELEQKRDAFTTRIFWLMFEMIFIFGIPAVIAVYLAKKLSATNTDMNWSAIFLFVSFVFSWFIVAMKYKKQNRILNDLNAQIKQARELENIKK